MPKNPNKLKPGQVALTCDKCSMPIAGDNGYLIVQNRRWRMYHDDCQPLAEIANAGSPGGIPETGAKPIVVRSSRVSTFSMLLTTLATLATDMHIDFANTAWPALLKRIAFDTDWCQTDGRKRGVALHKENADMIRAAGFNQKLEVGENVQ